MRKTLKFLHTLAACGMIGAVLGYAVILAWGPQDTPIAYADMRETIALLCNFILLPSLGLALVSGLLSIAFHRPFHSLRWVWVKALLGISMFEATLGFIGSKADYAATVSRQMAAGEAPPDALETALTYEWHALFVITLLSVVNIVLGVWRPSLAMRRGQRVEG